MLGAHIERAAKYFAGLSELQRVPACAVEQFRYTKIDYLDMLVSVLVVHQTNIAGLEIAVHNAVTMGRI
ncbi:MAG: hypothetical protein BWY75_01490 [bacterium ADurb.Bin425]|nr:MAG: hypothetical protein BWY75_01490 [bacterium ADurb.Bin425]